MLDPLTIKGRLIAAAMRLAAEQPWHQVTLAAIGEAAGVSLVDVRREFASKGDVLAAFVRSVDDAVLARSPQRAGGATPRDALFEVIMSRFDVLGPYKQALKSIAASWQVEPAVARAVCQSQAWMLRAAGIKSEGLQGQVRAAGLGAVYASVYRTWLGDDDPGLARTMAALDRRLRRGEETLQAADKVAGKLCGVAKAVCDVFRKPERTDTPPTPAASPAAEGQAG